MERSLIALGLLVVAGCASHDDHHTKYKDPHPPQVVIPAPAAGAVMATPPAGSTTLPPQSSAAAPALTENEAAEMARAEAYRRGWRNITVERAVFANNRWHVDFAEGDKRSAWIDVAPDGTILNFSERPHDHSDDQNPYR